MCDNHPEDYVKNEIKAKFMESFGSQKVKER